MVFYCFSLFFSLFFIVFHCFSLVFINFASFFINFSLFFFNFSLFLNVFQIKERIEEVKRKEQVYSSEPRLDPEVKSYDYYSKLYEVPKGPSSSQQQDFFFSPEKPQNSTGRQELQSSGDYEYKDFNVKSGEFDYKSPNY